MSDENRERYLGEIAPFLAAAAPLEGLSPESRRQIRRRVLRTLFRVRSVEFRIRLMPVLAALGLLALGGAAFATAQRFGLISSPMIVPADRETAKSRIERFRRTGRHPVAPLVAPLDDFGIDPTYLPAPIYPTTSPISGQATELSAPSASAPILVRKPRHSNSTTLRMASVRPALPTGSTGVRASVAPATAPYAASPDVATLEPPSAEKGSPIAQESVAPVAAPPQPKPPVARKPSASDQVLFGQAMRRLRWEHDPSAAYAALQEHEREYPRSALRSERTVLEVEALLALHRDAEALGRLDAMSLDELPRGGERYVLRGELRAGARRWQDAAADFDKALARVSGAPSWHERALWGRGVARLRCGESEPGLADIERYRDRYPHGRFAAEADRLLAKR